MQDPTRHMFLRKDDVNMNDGSVKRAEEILQQLAHARAVLSMQEGMKEILERQRKAK